MNSPKDYLTDRVKEFRKLFTNSYAGDSGIGGNDPQEADYSWATDSPIDVEKFLTETIQQSMEVGRQEGVKETEKAFGGCTKCYGKGYSTHMGSEEYDHTPIPLIDYCECSRGQQLKSLSKNYER